jgi:hypothetical protein
VHGSPARSPSRYARRCLQPELAALEATLIRLEREGAGASREEQRQLGAFIGLNGGTYFPLIEELGSPVSDRSPAPAGDR